MKRLIMGLALLLLLTQQLTAQTKTAKYRINAYAGYVFDDGVDSYYDAFNYYDGTIKGGFQWGLGAEYLVHPYYGIELSYYRQDTDAPMTYYQNGIKNTNFDLGISWILLGVNRYFKLDAPMITPYIGGGVGVAIVDIENPNTNYSDNATKFAWNFRGGTNINLSSRVAFKVQAQLMSAVQGAGGGLYFGTGGVGAGLSTYSTVLQFGFHGGLALSF
ncbi:outer membrane protein [Paraflavitalea pollutisoli]|uniref:outer membrane protein n=1 Tax=Paraflavitalea pollutisoli TaxID=3034143 RepID=UPI0023ED91E1|nr:outer membrane beta-barrel protein [Paraflavitalea sp. H1-2-19X]